MKRFYCTVCKRVKRVRKYPTNVDTPNAEIVLERVGQCNFHIFGRKRPEMSLGKSQQVRDFALKNNLPIIEIKSVKSRKAGR